MTPDRGPLPIFRDLCIVRHDLDVRRVLLAEEVVENSSQDRLQPSGDDVKRNGVVDAKLTTSLSQLRTYIVQVKKGAHQDSTSFGNQISARQAE